jgi:hypothetical protein
MSQEFREYMEIRTAGIDEKTHLESQMNEYLSKVENIKNRIGNIEKIEATEEILEKSHDEKLEKALGIIGRIIENQGEISKPQLQNIAIRQEVDYHEIMATFNADFILKYVKEFEAVTETKVDYF